MGTRFDVTIRAYHTHFPFREEIATGTHRYVFINENINPSDAKLIATKVIHNTQMSLYREGLKCLNQYQENSIRVHRAKRGRVKSLATIKKISCEDGEKDNGNM